MTSPTSFAAPKFEVKSRAVTGFTVVKIAVEHLNFFYGRTQALKDITIDIPERRVMAFIGPSGCGKTTFLRTLNRMNDVIPVTRVEGRVSIDDQDIYAAVAHIVYIR